MRDLVYEYLLAYYWHGVSDRNLKDLCRELIELEPEEASPDERQKMVDEACRVAVLASDEAEKFEDIANQLKAELSKHEGDDDFLDSIDFMLNAVTEDGERANSFTKEVTNLNLGGEPRTPRKPRVANPFLPIIRARREAEDEDLDEEVIEEISDEIEDDEEESPVETEDDETEAKVESGEEGDPDGEADEDETEAKVESGEEGDPDGEADEDETEDEVESGEEESQVETEDDETEAEVESGEEEAEKGKPFNPLADESERILNGEEMPVSDDETEDEEEHKSDNPLADESETILEDGGETPVTEDSDADSEIRSKLTGGTRRKILKHLGKFKRSKNGAEGKADRTGRRKDLDD